MEVSTLQYPRVAMIAVAGRVDSAKAAELESKLAELVQAEKIQIVLDLWGVEYMSSAGLATMVAMLKKVKRVNGDLRLCRPSRRLEEMLRLNGLTSVFATYPTPEEAMASF